MYDKLIKRLRETSVYFGESDDVSVMMIEAANAIEDLQKQLREEKVDNVNLTGWLAEEHAKHLWIPVTERLPEEDESVLVVRKFLGLKGQVPPSTYVEIANRIGDSWVADSDEYKIARHRHTDPLYWMPLPQPPKEET